MNQPTGGTYTLTHNNTSVQKCALCHEPGQTVDGVFIHEFSGEARCTYKSHL